METTSKFSNNKQHQFLNHAHLKIDHWYCTWPVHRVQLLQHQQTKEGTVQPVVGAASLSIVEYPQLEQ
jgi:hypothetical protein